MNGTLSTHKVFAFIQARTTSTRFPGKVLANFTEGPKRCILDHVIFRLRKVLPNNRIVLLIPYNDFQLIEFSKKNNVLYFEGDENNVRDRYIEAAKKFGAEWILRLTSDNPFLDLEHLELLIESIQFTDADLLSFLGLPLGASGEIFSFSALTKEPSSGLSESDKEHVSLHIKQYPKEFKVIKLENFLSIEERKIAPELRITIDEQNDMVVCQNIYENLKTNPNFGSREIINLYKNSPELFFANKEVKQVSFSIPPVEKKLEIKIGILYGNQKSYGSGHFERTKYLSVYLQSMGFQIEFTDMESNLSPNLDLYILDKRDDEIPEFLNGKKWILLDNFNTKKQNQTYFYSIPHPNIDFLTTFHNFLFTSQIYTLPEIDTEKQILAYSGNLDSDTTDRLDAYLLENFSDYKIIRIGNIKPRDKNILHFSRLTKFEFLSFIQRSEKFITYFGLSAMEALYLQKEVYLYSISSYHHELTQFLQNQCPIKNLGNIEIGLQSVIGETSSKKNQLISKNSGYYNLINIIKKSLSGKL